MAAKHEQDEEFRSDATLAHMIGRVARAANADTVICGTETGTLFQCLRECAGGLHLIAATPNGDTYDALVRAGFDPVRLSMRVADKYRQARHAISAALRAGRIQVGSLVVCGIGHDLCRGRGDLVLVTDVEADVAGLAFSEMIKLTDGIRPSVMEATLRVACRISAIVRRGKRIGALFMLGDSDKVLEASRQMVLNPFSGHRDEDRMITNPKIDDMLIELAKLDGAFVVWGDGFIRTAAAFLAGSEVDLVLPPGLGARHVAAAAMTAHTKATAVVVSATDGLVRAFSGGHMVLQVDPSVPFSSVAPPSP